jgi:hypothetical protein
MATGTSYAATLMPDSSGHQIRIRTMTDDRRGSLRRQVKLPFQWCATSAEEIADICDALHLPRSHALQSRLADLDDDMRRATATLDDSRLIEVLRVMNARLAVLEEAMLADARLPETQALELSADGVGFTAGQALPQGTLLGVHLVLPVSYHLVCQACVTHCAAIETGPGAQADRPDASGYRIGAEFRSLQPAAARRLTRFAISRDQEANTLT